MRIQNIDSLKYKELYTINSTASKIKFGEDDNEEKVNNKLVEEVKSSTVEEDSNNNKENEDVITSKIVTNGNGIRVLLMMKNSKVFSSVNIGESKNDFDKISNGLIEDDMNELAEFISMSNK